MAKQSVIPGMERANGDKELDEMIAARRKTSKMRKKWQDREIEEGGAIERHMQEKKITFYVNKDHSPPLYAKLGTSTKLKIDEYEDDEVVAADDDETDDGPAAAAEPGEQKARKKSASAEA